MSKGYYFGRVAKFFKDQEEFYERRGLQCATKDCMNFHLKLF